MISGNSAQLRITLIAQRSRVLFRLPEIFSADNVHVTLIARPDYALAQSPFIHRFIPLIGSQSADENEAFVEDLIGTGVLDRLEDAGDWIIVAEDLEIRLLSESGLPSATLDLLLPAKHDLGRSLFDSKVGLSNALSQLRIPQPPTLIAEDRGALEEILLRIDTASLVKADSGHGGKTIAYVPIPNEFDLATIPTEWFPVIVQEFVEGELCAVEAQFVQGQLVGYLYSTVLKRFSQLGNSTDRLFTTPPDDQVEIALATLGKAGCLHGLANCTFIREASTSEYLLIEVDLRPNIWHQFGPKLGVNWVSLYRNPPDRPIHNEGSQPVAHYPRSLLRAVKHRDLATARMWISRDPGTWEMRNKKDQVANRADLRAIYQNPWAKILISIRRVTPAPIQRAMKKYGIRSTGRRLVTSAPEN